MDITFPLLILCIPLFMFLLLGIAGCKMSHKMAGILGTAGMGVTAVMAYTVALTYFLSGNPEFIDASGQRLQYIVFNVNWLAFTDDLVIRLGFYLDSISAMMLIVITTVSFMVHLYSLGYMHGERGFQRYYAFLSLFSFSMLGLVVATNIFQMYIFWELVGVSSYLLIGFYYTKHAAVSASKKRLLSLALPTSDFLSASLSCRSTARPLISPPSPPTRWKLSAEPPAPPSSVLRYSPGGLCSSSSAAWANRQ